MKILFINCLAETNYTYTMPLAASYLVSFLKSKLKEKIIVKVISIADKNKIVSIVQEFKPDLVGLSTTTPGYDFAKEISSEIKKINSKIIIVVGGSHVTLFNECLIREIDYGVIGEGEETFYELFDHLFPNLMLNPLFKNIEQINGLIHWQDDKMIINPPREFIKNLDNIGHPDRRLLNPTNNMIFTSRGCPFNCIYCSSPIIWKRTFRMHSAKYIFEEIKELYKLKHSVQWFGDDLFVCNKQRIKDLIRLLKEENILGKISFIALGRSENIDEEMVLLLKELNVIVVHFGFETGDNEILQYAKNSKHISVEKNINASNLCRKHGILVQGYIMIGFPQETSETINKTYEFAKKYSDTGGKPNIVMVFPKTALCEELKIKTGKDYSKIHLEEIKFSFGGDMPITKETIICEHLTPEELERYKIKFHKYGVIKMKKYYVKLLKKLILSKGSLLNIHYLLQSFKTEMNNPKREFVSEEIAV